MAATDPITGYVSEALRAEDRLRAQARLYGEELGDKELASDAFLAWLASTFPALRPYVLEFAEAEDRYRDRADALKAEGRLPAWLTSGDDDATGNDLPEGVSPDEFVIIGEFAMRDPEKVKADLQRSEAGRRLLREWGSDFETNLKMVWAFAENSPAIVKKIIADEDYPGDDEQAVEFVRAAAMHGRNAVVSGLWPPPPGVNLEPAEPSQSQPSTPPARHPEQSPDEGGTMSNIQQMSEQQFDEHVSDLFSERDRAATPAERDRVNDQIQAVYQQRYPSGEDITGRGSPAGLVAPGVPNEPRGEPEGGGDDAA